MKVFKSNTTRIVIACFIIFMAIPFIFVESDEVVKNSTPGIPLEQSSNPLAKIIDRIGSFYGFKKNAAKQNRSSFAKKGDVLASTKMRGKGHLSSSEMAQTKDSSVDLSGLLADSESASGVSSRPGHRPPALPEVKEYIRMDGGTYEVIKDHEGRKFVAMPDGFVPYEKLMSDTVSQEEFEAAKKQAPQLEDWEIFEALRSPGGLPAYLASGGNSAFYRDNNRGYYDKEGKEGTRLFGMRSSGRGGDNDDIYDERKLAASIAANTNKVNGGASGGRASLSSIRSKHQANQTAGEEAKNEEEKSNQEVNFSDLIETGIIIGNKKEILKSDKSTPSKSFAGTQAEGNTEEEIEVFEVGSVNDDVNDHMFKAFADFGVKAFQVKSVSGETIRNQWKYPEVASMAEKDAPGTAFTSINTFPESLRESFSQTDRIYAENSKQINEMQKINNFKLNIAVVDGADDNGIKAVRSDSFHYKIVEGLTGAKDIAKKGYISIKPEDKAKTLIVVSDNETWKNLKKAGYNVVMFNKYAITPNDLNSFYDETLSTVRKMSANIASSNKVSEKEYQKIASSLKNANARI